METKEKPYKVCLMGASFDTGNRGVSALAASLVQLIKEVKPDAQISFLIGTHTPKSPEVEISGHKTKVNVVNFRLSPRAHLQEHLLWIFLMAWLYRTLPFKIIRDKIIKSNIFLKTLLQADFVGDIRGGDSFSDIYGLRRFIVGCIPAIIALLLRKRLVLLPQTYGPYNSNLSQPVARFIIKRSTKILSRDRQSIELIEKMVGNQDENKRISFCPDVAFVMGSVKPEKLDVQPPLTGNINVPLIGLNINGLMYNGGYTGDNMFGLKFNYKEFLNKLVLRLVEETQADILLLPHTFGPPGNVNSDPDACRDVLKLVTNYFRNRLHLLMQEYNQYEIKGIIGLCDFLIGSRMHACIGGLSQGVPTVGVGYSKKFQGIFDSIDLGELVVDTRLVDMETAIQKVLDYYNNRENIRMVIRERIDIVQNKIRETFQTLLTKN